MHLTKREIDATAYDPAGPSVQRLWDDQLPGFGVRIYPSGRKAFILKYRHKGQQRQAVIGQYGPLTLQQARDAALKMHAELLNEHDPLTERRRRREIPTFRAFCTEYLDRHAKAKKKSWEQDRRRIDTWLLPAWGPRRMDAITKMDVATLHNKIGKNAPYQANRVAALVRKMFDLAAQWGVVEEATPNPAARVEKFREQKRDRWVTEEELPRLAKAIDGADNVFIRAALWMYLLTGVRKQELLQAQWEHMDLDRREWRIPDTKAGRPHYVPLSPSAVAILQTMPRFAGNPYVFPGRIAGRPLTDIKRSWDTIRKEAGIEDVRLHDLRRTVGSWLAQSGNSMLVIQKALNHSTYSATLVYARMSENPVRKALEEHDAHLMAVAKMEPTKS